MDFDRNQTQVTHWQNQLNFAIYDALLANGNNTRNLFINYKVLNEEWNAYVKDSRNDEIEAEYNLKWNNNPYFNFSNYIREDMKSFLQVIINIMLLLFFHRHPSGLTLVSSNCATAPWLLEEGRW